jgi:hypothetical protein
MVLSSETFDPVEAGCTRPLLPPTMFEKVHVGNAARRARELADKMDACDRAANLGWQPGFSHPAAVLLRELADLIDPPTPAYIELPRWTPAR